MNEDSFIDQVSRANTNASAACGIVYAIVAVAKAIVLAAKIVAGHSTR